MRYAKTQTVAFTPSQQGTVAEIGKLLYLSLLRQDGYTNAPQLGLTKARLVQASAKN